MGTDNWYYSYDGETYGPFGLGQIQTFAIRGDLIPSDMIWTEGWSEWFPAGALDNFLPDIWNPLKTHQVRTNAENPGLMTLSRAKLRRFPPTSGKPVAFINRCLGVGDARGAVVVRTDPLIVASYTDEFDCVILLQFDPAVAAEFHLEPGSQLVSTNFYSNDLIQMDLSTGPKASGRWSGVDLMIADFLTDDTDRLQAVKRGISAAEWETTLALGRRALVAPSPLIRDGSPFESHRSVMP